MTEIAVKRREQTSPSRFRVRPETSDEKAVGEVFKNNSYQRKAFKIGRGEKWVDMGANIGAFSVFVASLGNDVVSYEAEPYNAQATETNLVINGVTPRVIQKAVVPQSFEGDFVTFYVLRRPMALRRHSISQPKKDFETIQVPVVRWLDAIPDGFDCLKMNIEGVEIDILKEASVPELRRFRKLVFEWSFDKEPQVDVLRNVLAKLALAFPYVDCSRKLPPDLKVYKFYPPNAFVYACRD